MRRTWLVVMAFPLLAAAADISGDWEFTARRMGDDSYFRVTLKAEGDKFTGSLNELKLEGAVKGGAIEFTAHRPGGELFGTFHGVIEGDTLAGDAVWFEKEKVTWTARRPVAHPAAPAVHDFAPTEFHRQFSGAIPPVMHIFPGDTVRTWTVDAGGVDAHGVRRSLGGNPETGPFYIEGAFPGDTLVIKLNKVRLNRDSAGSGDRTVGPALNTGYIEDTKYKDDFDS